MEALADESRLVRKAKSGDTDAFVQLYEAYFERVYKYVYFRVMDEKLAESITPRVFIKAWQLLDRYHTFGLSFITWLYKLASEQVVEHFRAHPRPKNSSDPNGFWWSIEDDAFDESVRDMFDLQAMRDALQFLTNDEQQALTLKFIAGVSTATIAQMMARPLHAVHDLLLHALQTVAKYMDEKEMT
ncbi:MAG: sigma-70 family RNA polymerase sigma factor [Chloroflexi bacterium]|nr:sigma-70 family RNA polymerase sigma factor [Chloroflexota bacterium]